MKQQRYNQLKELWLDRNDLNYQLRDLNKNILKKSVWTEILKQYLEKEILTNVSIDYMELLRFKLLKIVWLKIKRDTEIYLVLYNLIMDNILLPNYVDWWKEEDIMKELSDIIWRVEKRVNMILERIQKWSFNISLWNRDAIINELDWYDWNYSSLQYRSYNIGGVFWLMYMWFNEDVKKFIVQISVRLKDWMVKNWEEGLIKNMDSKEIEHVLEKCFKEKISNSKRWTKEKWLKKFEITYKKKVNSDNRYWIDSDSNYYIINIENKDVKNDLDTTFLNEDEILNYLEWFTKAANLIVNKLAKNSWVEHKKMFYTFWSDEPYYYEDEDDEQLSRTTIEKYSKMLVSDKTPVHLEEVWGQKEAKEEISKIIKAIKYEEVMKSWWARLVNGIIFYWPPGTGKTLLAKVIATEVNAEVYNIKLTDIASSAYINEWANNVKDLFKFLRNKAKATNWKLIVILDELDALFKKRDWKNQSAEDTKIVNTFLTEMSGFEDVDNIIFIWTTNNVKVLDPAVIRSWRLSQKIKVDLPDFEARKQIFDIHINKAKENSNKAKESFNGIDLDKLAWAKELSWADIEEVIRKIVEKKALEEVEGKKNIKIITKEILEIIKLVVEEKEEEKIMWFIR